MKNMVLAALVSSALTFKCEADQPEAVCRPAKCPWVSDAERDAVRDRVFGVESPSDDARQDPNSLVNGHKTGGEP